MPRQDVSSAQHDTPAFPDHLRGAIQTLRGAIIELLASLGGDPTKPKDLSRRFKVNKNLTWKISKIVNTTDLYAAVPHIPGSAGFQIFFGALEKAGAPADLLSEARRAASEFDHVVKVHTGDRATLEIMSSDMLPPPAQSEQHEQSRKLAYQGNSGTLGVRARVQLSLNILAPNQNDPEQCDLVQIGGLVGFQRLRRDARWLLFRRERWTDEAPLVEEDQYEPLDPDCAPDLGVPLIREFCSKPLPEIESIAATGEDQYELPPGPVGNTAALTCVFGSVVRAVGPVYAEKAGEHSEVGSNLITPAEQLVLDLLVHRSFEWAMNPKLVIYSRMDGGAIHTTARRGRNVLAVPETVHDLEWGIAGLATTLIPRYTRIAAYAFDRLGWNADDFRAFRLTMQYPPIPTAVLLQSDLPERGQAR
jgi:hypothetical protein